MCVALLRVPLSCRPHGAPHFPSSVATKCRKAQGISADAQQPTQRSQRQLNFLGAPPSPVPRASVRSQYNATALAFLGDAVWEAYVRQACYVTGGQALHAYNQAVKKHANAKQQVCGLQGMKLCVQATLGHACWHACFMCMLSKKNMDLCLHDLECFLVPETCVPRQLLNSVCASSAKLARLRPPKLAAVVPSPPIFLPSNLSISPLIPLNNTNLYTFFLWRRHCTMICWSRQAPSTKQPVLALVLAAARVMGYTEGLSGAASACAMQEVRKLRPVMQLVAAARVLQ